MAGVATHDPAIRLLRDGGDDAFEVDLRRIASLHRVLLPHTASSRAGEDAVRALYRALARDGEAVVMFADEADGAEGAFGCGTLSLRETERWVRSRVSANRAMALRLAVWNLLAPSHLAARVAWDRTIPREGAGYVLTLGAARRSRVRGAQVLHALERELAVRGATAFWVDTEGSNGRALAFYARNGYEVVSRRFGQVLLRKRA